MISNKNLLNIIFALLFIICFVKINKKIPQTLREYLEDYRFQLFIIIIILLIALVNKYSAILLFILFMTQYRLSNKEYFVNKMTKQSFFNNMIDSINETINFENGNEKQYKNINDLKNQTKNILLSYLENDISKYNKIFNKSEKYNPEQIINF